MGNEAWCITGLWRGGCVRYSHLIWHLRLFTDKFVTSSTVVGLFLLIIPALQRKGRYLRVSGMYLVAMGVLTGMHRNTTRYDV